MVIVGAGGIGMAVTANTTIQLSVPDHLRGRVMSLYTTVFAGSVPAGGLLMGWIASAWGVPPSLLVGAIAEPRSSASRRGPGWPGSGATSGRPARVGPTSSRRRPAARPPILD